MFGRQFALITWKNLIIARRRYIWTLCQIFVPVLLGIPLMLHCYVIKDISPVNRTMNVTIQPNLEVNGSKCSEKYLLYINNVANFSQLEHLLASTKMQRLIFNNTQQLYEDLSERATTSLNQTTDTEQLRVKKDVSNSTIDTSPPYKQTTHRQDHTTSSELTTSESGAKNIPLYGVQFKSLKNLSLAYIIHAPVASTRTLLDFKELITSETWSMSLRNTENILTDEDLETQQCIIDALLESYRELLGLDHRKITLAPVSVMKVGRRYERSFIFEIYIIIIVSVIALLVTYNVAYDARMKEFLLIMSAQRMPLLMTCIVGNYVKASISLVLIHILPWVLDDESPLLVTFIAVELLGFNAVVFGVFCGTIYESTVGALKLATVLWLILLYFALQSPRITGTYWLVSICHANPIAAFKNIFEALPYFELRGTSVTISTLYAYTDMVTPGSSLVALAADGIFMIGVTIIVDNVEWCYIRSRIAALIRRKQLEQLKSQTERHSWHQDEEVRELKPDIDAEDVAKVWESSGELSVYRFEIRAYPGEVSVILGHPGAGKTTTFKMMCGSIRPTRGRIKILDKDIFRYRTLCRTKIGFSPDKIMLYNELTAKEHLWFFYFMKRPRAIKLKGKWRTEAEVLIESLDMDSFKDRLVSQLSPCQKRKLNVALAFVGGSRIVFLDEPTIDMDQSAKECLYELVRQQKDCRTIMVSTQNMEDAEAMGQQLYVMYMGRTICSGDVNFIKSSFGTDYVLTIMINEQNVKETIKRLEEGITGMIHGARIRSKEGDQIRIELPRDQEKNFPEMFAKLEEEQQMRYVKDYRLTYGVIEETFIKMGETTEVNRSTEMEPLGSEPNAAFRAQLCIWQFVFLIWKKILFSLFHIPLILYQIVLPVLVSVYLGYSMSVDAELPSAKGKISLQSFRHGRFLIFNPYNVSEQQNLTRKVLQKYPQLEVATFYDSDVERHWPADWPWVVGGIHIKNPWIQKDTYEFIAPEYISFSKLYMLHFANDIMLKNGSFQWDLEIEMRLRKDRFNRNEFVLVPFIMMLMHILLTSSFAVTPAEEQHSHFKHMQLTTGLNVFLYWFYTMLYDVFMAALLCLFFLFVLFLWDWTLSMVFYPLMVMYCLMYLPLAYLLSTLSSKPGYAFVLLVVFQLFSYIPLFLASDTIKSWVAYIAYVYPSLIFLSAIIDETGKRKLFDFCKIQLWIAKDDNDNHIPAYVTYIIVLASNWLFYCFLLFLYESQLHTAIISAMKRRTFTERFDVPYGNDVVAERMRSINPGGSNATVLVRDLVKFRKQDCVLKNIAFAMENNDALGLIGVPGSGKSTAFNLISGIERPSSGKVLITGRQPHNLPRLGFCADYNSLFPRLTCLQNLIVIVGLIGYKNVRKKAESIIGYLSLRLHANRLVIQCSQSQRRRINVALALMTRGPLIVIDEPTKGIDPNARRDIWKIMLSTQLTNRAMLFASSSMEECEELGTRYGVLCDGRFVSAGSIDALREHHAKLCVLQVDLTKDAQKQKVLDTVQITFANAVPIPTPDESLRMRWHVYISEGETLSTLFTKAQNLAVSPVRHVHFTHASFEEALVSFGVKFTKLQRKASKRELVNQLLTVIQ